MLSPDDLWIFYAQVNVNSDLMLVENFRQDGHPETFVTPLQVVDSQDGYPKQLLRRRDRPACSTRIRN